MDDEYNLLLSRACLELQGHPGALASPTLSKQETVTFLYERILRGGGRTGPRLRGIVLRAEFTLRLIVRVAALLIAASRNRVRSLPRRAIYVRTWLVPRSFAQGTIVDDYFKRLIDDLRRETSVVVGFQPLSLRDYFTGFRGAASFPGAIIPVGLLSARDILAACLAYVRTGRARLRGPFVYRGRDVTAAINDSLDDDFFKLRSFPAYLERRITEKLAAFEPRAFLYIFENQAWEKAALSVLQGHPSTCCIGYQTSGFSDRFLNFFPSELDRMHAPFPSVVLTVGDLFTRVMQTRGHYPCVIRTFGATRFDYPASERGYFVQQPRTEVLGRVLYAFAVHEYQYARIVRDLTSVFADSAVEVVLKFHPLFGGKFERLKLPRNFRVWTPGGGTALRDEYDLVLFNDNSVGFESLLQGVRAYEYVCEPVYSEHRLYGFDIYDCVLDASRLPLIRDRIADGTLDKSLPVDAVSAYIESVYRPYTPAACRGLLELIDAAGVT